MFKSIFQEKNIHTAFRIGIILKAIDGFVETASGLALLFIKPDTINGIVSYYVRDELAEEPHSLIANYFLQHGHLTESAAVFTVILLLTRGVVKLAVAAGLLKDILVVYPIALVIYTGFVIYQLYYVVTAHSLPLLALSIFDVIVIALTAHEWGVRRRAISASAPERR